MTFLLYFSTMMLFFHHGNHGDHGKTLYHDTMMNTMIFNYHGKP
jgi:hypothetical protein